VDAWLYGSGLHELDEHDARVRAVTRAQIRDAARRYFVEDRRVEGVVRGVVKTV
jgi:predicted Zn-dependent peptidase